VDTYRPLLKYILEVRVFGLTLRYYQDVFFVGTENLRAHILWDSLSDVVTRPAVKGWSKYMSEEPVTKLT
jgi:hypothetical protein